MSIISSFLFLWYVSDSKGTNVRVPPKEGHVINRSLLVFSVCRGGKIFGVGGKENSEKLWSILRMLNYKFTAFAKVESAEKTGMLNLCENYTYFEECTVYVGAVCVCTQSGHYWDMAADVHRIYTYCCVTVYNVLINWWTYYRLLWRNGVLQ